jgi:hypothetical protein
MDDFAVFNPLLSELDDSENQPNVFVDYEKGGAGGCFYCIIA